MKNLSKLTVEKIAKDKLHAVKGGCGCTGSTFSSCHIDGSNDGDTVVR